MLWDNAMCQISFPSCSFSRSCCPCTLLGCSWNKNSLFPAILWTGFSWAGFFVQEGGWSRKEAEFVWEISLQVLPPQAKAAARVSALSALSGCSMLTAWMLRQPPQEPQCLLLPHRHPTTLQSSQALSVNPAFTDDRETPPLNIKLWSYSITEQYNTVMLFGFFPHLQPSENQGMRLPQLFRVFCIQRQALSGGSWSC